MNMNKNDLVKRNFQCEFRTEENSDGIVIGVPIVFDTPTDIGGQFEEVIDKDAISEEILKTGILQNKPQEVINPEMILV